ncbi:unnamed protein product, partial [marine sediment metagenome]
EGKFAIKTLLFCIFYGNIARYKKVLFLTGLTQVT